jgi:hypothetical protein
MTVVVAMILRTFFTTRHFDRRQIVLDRAALALLLDDRVALQALPGQDGLTKTVHRDDLTRHAPAIWRGKGYDPVTFVGKLIQKIAAL